MPDGSPQVTPVWVEVVGDTLLVNTAAGRIKADNMARDPRVALSVVDPDDPYHYVSVRGRVTDITPDGADEQNDRLAKKYMGLDRFPFDTSRQTRLVFTITPDKIYEYGPGTRPERTSE